MRLITWNILSGAPLREGANLFDAVRTYDADVLAIQEVDHLQDRSFGLKTVEEIAERCAYPYWIFAPTMHGTPGSPYSVADTHKSHANQNEIPTSYGVGLLSRVPIKKYEILKLKKAPYGLPLLVASPKGQRVMFVPDEPRVAIAAILEDDTVVVTAHLSFVPPFNSLQLRRIKKWASSFGNRVIYMGDFNALLFGKAGLKSLNTAKSYPGWNPKLKFDFILSNDVDGVELNLEYLGVSDHKPLGIEI
mgnify:CR=1 FL=1